MGNCRSCESRSAATAKLILSNGQLQEFSYPVKVSTLMQHGAVNYLDRFICSSNDMEIGEAFVAVGGDEELRPGEVYFELPSRWRKHRMQAEDMAALAVKASLALAGGDDAVISCSCYAFKRVDHAMVVLNDKERPFLVADGGRGRGCGRFKGGKFLPKLSVIVEEL
ncbi:uncharacterized protein LOC142505657 [Primulina tabacum]|uniref:uncharacterized protein LOC142505657 n=1 Tax=Primulina tabacum TaxID=48773 RepID=UPI003F594D75